MRTLPTWTIKLMLATVVLLLGSWNTAWSTQIAYDDFERTPDNTLGSTPIGGYSWVETENAANTISLVNAAGSGRAQFNSRGNGTDPVGMLNVNLADVDVSVVMQSYIGPSGNYFGGIRYRSPVPSAGFASDVNPANSGYGVYVVPGVWGPGGYSQANMIGLQYGNTTVVASAVLSSPILQDTDYTLRVVAQGDHHQVYWDGNLVIDYTELTAGRNYAGGAGLGSYYGSWYFDNFSVSTVVPEPNSLIMVAVGGCLMMFRKRRRAS